ncbi:MAG: MFS transporter [Planctomycetes bacterium]|nr:MFS transporter [Planctomycetota bacterium]
MIKRWAEDWGETGAQARRYLMGCAFLGAAGALPWTLLNLYLDRLGYTKTEIGSVTSMHAWGTILVALPAAYILARRRAGRFLATAAFICGLSLFALPWMPSLGWFRVAEFMVGLSFAIHHIAVAPFIYRHTGERERQGVFALAEAVGTLASVVGSFSGGQLADLLTPILDSDSLALACVLSGAGFLGLAAAIVYAGIREDEPVVDERAPKILDVVREHRGIALRFVTPHIVLGVGAGACIPFLSLYFRERFGLGDGDVGTLWAVGGLMTACGFLIAPYVSRQLGLVRGIVALELASIVFFIVLAYTNSLVVAIIAFLFRGALMNSGHPLFMNLVMKVAPEGAKEFQNGMQSMAWSVGWVLGPVVGGAILDSTGNDYSVLMLTTVGFYTVSSVLTYVLLLPLERRHGEEVKA